MALRIEDYALIGDTESAALVGRNGSIDWMCLPSFSSDACFAALLGDERHGRWLLAPAGRVLESRRRYRPGTLILETTYKTDDGEVRVIDCMPPRKKNPDIIRIVEGVSGEVAMRTDLAVRFGYGAVLPWIRKTQKGFTLLAGPDALSLLSSGAVVSVDGADLCADFRVRAGEKAAFQLTWHPSHEPPPKAVATDLELRDTEAFWRDWSSGCSYTGRYCDLVLRSLITLKALTYLPTGGIVAAATTSLPERIGGVRNWDYRVCWVRDATFTLLALIGSGFKAEAEAWCKWLMRAAAGHPSQLHIMYGIAGERRLPELELSWLPGYEGSRPIRIGNEAVSQFQLDVYGELMDCIHHARMAGIHISDDTWCLQQGTLEFLAAHWREPDNGIWEVRGPRRHFTHSKVMAWVAFDRAIRDVEQFGLSGPVDHWRKIRDEIHDEVCREGYDARRNTFTQYYGSRDVDASLLFIPLVGFLPPDDPRVLGTIEMISKELCRDGLIYRYRPDPEIEGLPGHEGIFIACSFWMADCLSLLGRRDEARTLFERGAALCNDVGLLSEEYDPDARRLLGNFPQALSHVALVIAAESLDAPGGLANARSRR